MPNIEDLLMDYLGSFEYHDPLLKGIYLEKLFEEKLNHPALLYLFAAGIKYSDQDLISRTKEEVSDQEEEIIGNAKNFTELLQLYSHVNLLSLYNPRFISNVGRKLISSADNFSKAFNLYCYIALKEDNSLYSEAARKLLMYTKTFEEKERVYAAAVNVLDEEIERKIKEDILKTASFSELGKFVSLARCNGRKGVYWEVTKERLRR